MLIKAIVINIFKTISEFTIENNIVTQATV
jgi:hypothetical protein